MVLNLIKVQSLFSPVLIADGFRSYAVDRSEGGFPLGLKMVANSPLTRAAS